jgi:CubicO group peptidase (beta-lactamase class C family)
VRRGNEIILNKGYGWANAEARVANAPTTLYDVGSIAKTFTAAAILDLEARGLLSVGDPISRHLPGLPADKQAITIHQLLTHTAGFPLDAEHVGGTAADTTAQLLAKIAAARLLHSPGTTYHYSNVGYGLLALIVERVSGQSWQSYLRRRLLNRAGLRGTYLWGERLPPRAVLATGYMGATDEEAQPQPALAHGANSPLLWGKYLLGSGGIYSSVEDLSRWWCALSGDRLLPPVQRSRMFTVQAANQGYGWNIAQSGSTATRISRGGLRGSYESLVSHYPETDALIVFGMNRNIANRWSRLVWGSLARAMGGGAVPLPPPLAVVPAGAAERHAGRYRLTSGGSLWLRASRGALYFGLEGQDALNRLVYPAGAPAHLDRIGSLSQRITAALDSAGGDAVLTRAGLSAEQVRALRAQWSAWTAETGGLTATELLGSTPGAESYTRTFLRLRGPRGERVIRLLWNPALDRLLAWGDDIPLPAHERLWPQSENQFVAYDLDTDRLMTFAFTGHGRVTVMSRGGALLLTATR